MHATKKKSNPHCFLIQGYIWLLSNNNNNNNIKWILDDKIEAPSRIDMICHLGGGGSLSLPLAWVGKMKIPRMDLFQSSENMDRLHLGALSSFNSLISKAWKSGYMVKEQK